MLVHDVFDSKRHVLDGWKQAGVSAEETRTNGPCWTRNSYFKALWATMGIFVQWQLGNKPQICLYFF